MLNNSCAFTGHRPHKLPWKYNETDSRCIRLKATLTDQIIRLMENGVTRFFSGMAEGTDCWAARAVLDLRTDHPELELHCVLPCEGQADKWTVSAQEQYQAILKQADSVEYVSRKYHKNCMLDRNRRLVDSAFFLLAVYNGSGAAGRRRRYVMRESWGEKSSYSIRLPARSAGKDLDSRRNFNYPKA